MARFMLDCRISGRRGFSLIELLVVLSIISIVIAISVPLTSVVIESTQATTGINTVTVAATAARAYSNRGDAMVDLNPLIPNASYSGTAILFTPSGEIRLLENDQTAMDTAPAYLEPDYNGFRDLGDREYIDVPRGSSVVGITRAPNVDGTNPGLMLFAPPFAIRFDRNGQLIAADVSGAPNADWVIYNGAGMSSTSPIPDAAYDRTMTRDNPYTGGTPYNPSYWDPGSSFYNPSATYDPDQDKHTVPFEAIETVIGVIIYNRNRFNDQQHPDNERFQLRAEYAIPDGLTAPGSNAQREALWLLENGTVRFFNRYTGVIMKE